MTDNRYVEDLLKIKKTHQCKKHLLPLHLFCKNCLEEICPSCAAVRHKGHDVMDLEDRVETIKAEMYNKKENVREISLLLGSHLRKLNDDIYEVNAMTSHSLNAIDEAREELHRKVKEIHERIQTETEKQKTKLLQNQKENIVKINNLRQETLRSKLLFDQFCKDIENALKTSGDNEIAQTKYTIDKDFLELKRNSLLRLSYDFDGNILKYTKPDFSTQLKLKECGKFSSHPFVVPFQETLGEPMKESLVPRSKIAQTINTGLENWTGTKMCVNRDGLMVLSGKIEDDHWLKCVNASGDCLWLLCMGKVADRSGRIHGLFCVQDGIKYFVVVKGKSAELRSVENGTTIDTCHMDFICNQACATSADTFLLWSVESNPQRVAKVVIKHETERPRLELIDHDDNKNTTQKKNPPGYVLWKYEGKQLVIATSKREKTIHAVDYRTDEVVLKIAGEYEGKKIQPLSVCHDDTGNLYITDGNSNRVLIVSPEGKVKQRLTNTPRTTYWTGKLQSHRLVVNYSREKEMIKFSQIAYIKH